MLDVCLLGCGGSVPVPERFLTSMFISYMGKKLLIDCGEGTQLSIKVNKLGFKNIDVILITHFHADHVAGLPGLLLTIANSGRVEPLNIVGPEGLKMVINGLRVIAPQLPYEVKLTELAGKENYFQKLGDFNINALSVDHRIPCMAYSICISRGRIFSMEKAIKNNVPVKFWSRLQKGEKIKYKGRIYNSNMILGRERRGIKFSYCTDSRPMEEIVDFVKYSDLFVCEGTYGDNEKFEKAFEYKHMLFREAASLAASAEVKELWLTHFSPSMVSPEDYLEDTRKIFNNTIIGQNGLKKTINFEDN